MLHRRKSGCAMFASLPGIFQKHFVNPHVFSLSLSPESALAVGKRLSSNTKNLPGQSAQDIISTTLAPLHAVHIPWYCSQWASSKCPAFPSPLQSKNARAKYELPFPLNFQPGHPFFACSNISRKDPPVEWISLGVSFGVWGAEWISTKNPPKGDGKCGGGRKVAKMKLFRGENRNAWWENLNRITYIYRIITSLLRQVHHKTCIWSTHPKKRSKLIHVGMSWNSGHSSWWINSSCVSLLNTFLAGMELPQWLSPTALKNKNKL